MSEPQSAEEYVALFSKNQKLTGYGMDVTCHAPCGFCAAPDWLVYKILETEEKMQEGATCSNCQRTGKFIFIVDEPNRKQFQFVQTGGPPAPDWLVPKPRYDPQA